MLTFTVYLAEDGWRWRAQARNGRIVADSAEAYMTRRRCEDMAVRISVGGHQVRTEEHAA